MKMRTMEPGAALSRLVLLALLGIVLLAGEMIAVGLVRGSWLLITAGGMMLVGGISTTWRSRREVRVGLATASGGNGSSS